MEGVTVKCPDCLLNTVTEERKERKEQMRRMWDDGYDDDEEVGGDLMSMAIAYSMSRQGRRAVK